jgi:hypothetical protein
LMLLVCCCARRPEARGLGCLCSRGRWCGVCGVCGLGCRRRCGVDVCEVGRKRAVRRDRLGTRQAEGKEVCEKRVLEGNLWRHPALFLCVKVCVCVCVCKCV